MLNDASGFRRIYLATGYTDLRRGMEGLASIIKFNFQLDPYQKDILFLFCGRRTDRIKGLVWEGDGFLLLYKRLELGAFNWPRTKEEKCERDCSLRSSQPDRSNLSSGQPDGGTACKSQKDVPSGQYQTSCRGLLCMGKRDPD